MSTTMESGAGSKFGWKVVTESESTTAAKESTVVGDVGATVAESTVAVKWAEADNGVGVMGSSPITS